MAAAWQRRAFATGLQAGTMRLLSSTRYMLYVYSPGGLYTQRMGQVFMRMLTFCLASLSLSHTITHSKRTALAYPRQSGVFWQRGGTSSYLHIHPQWINCLQWRESEAILLYSWQAFRGMWSVNYAGARTNSKVSLGSAAIKCQKAQARGCLGQEASKNTLPRQNIR